MGVAETLRVVLVDDVADLRYLLRTVLETSGRFEVVGEAGDAHRAIEAAAASQPDIVLLDVDLPGLSGIDALPDLRSAVPDAKIIMLSGFERERFWPAAAAGGAVAYLEKGLPPKVLVEQLLEAAGVLDVIQTAIAEARTKLAADLQSAGSARRFLDETLQQWDCDATFDTVNLLVTELVTNAVVHAQSDVEVIVSLSKGMLRVDVLDHSDERPVLRHPGEYDTSGRGLALVDAMARAWGVDPRPRGGKSVWFEVPASDAER